MNCPVCQHAVTRVFNKRKLANQNVIWRRRTCLSCRHRFTTREIEDSYLIDLLSKVAELKGILKTREMLARLSATKP